MSDDKTLQARVMDELEWEPRLNAAHLAVTARDGVVTLNGFVESYAAKALAEKAARRVRGVRAIAEEIEVRLPNNQKHSDDEIADRALRILAWDLEIPDDRIQVKVEHGLVTLTGAVNYHFQRTAAEADIHKLGGVRGVQNLITVEPLPGHGADPELVCRKIESALRRSAELQADQIDVSVDGGEVILRGRVQTWWERSVAENAAWAAPGVRRVRDEIEVRPGIA
ncbi:MAG TPA: BON domain-containing protein [Acidobacteriaceae bacterium]|jgi:osmotically-inducible protein OsmY|nr:BON domain-containing protein [Acidobacteriaceae bacterium]